MVVILLKFQAFRVINCFPSVIDIEMDGNSAEPEKSVTVAVRIRPLSSSETATGVQSCVHTISDQVVAIKKVKRRFRFTFLTIASDVLFIFDTQIPLSRVKHTEGT